MADYYPTNYDFIAPVRKFKANDPYYWEVDNIPLTQIEQNCLWLKEQVEGIIGEFSEGTPTGGAVGAGGKGTSLFDIKRGNISELRPSVDTRTVSVEPGRFSARVNDAYTLGEAFSTPKFSINDGSYVGQGGSWTTENAATVEASVDYIFSTGTSMRLNGLIERFSQYPVNQVGLGSFVTAGDENLDWTGKPLLDYIPFYNNLANLFTDVKNNISYTQTISKEFTKRWRGVARTALVDVGQTLTVDIPAFDADDFFTIDSAGTKTPITASHRIDLVFIYTKPVDQDVTQVFNSGGTESIAQASLGVVVGAGLGVDKSTANFTKGEYAKIIKATDGTASDAVAAFMLPDVADEAISNGGFIITDGTRISGSFPSPDDLLNLAPLLANDLADNDWRLVGQSVLPVAYVVVKSTESSISSKHLIDIRPFFRTAELTGDERAGIAAAAPSLSIANPAVGKRELETHINTAITAGLGIPQGQAGEGPLVPRTVGGGYIWGGQRWGPEGAITDMMGDGGAWLGGANEYGPNMSYGMVPDNPDWDWATWSYSLESTEEGQGTYKNDWMNYKYAINRNMASKDSTLDFQESGVAADDELFTNSFGTDIGAGDQAGDDGNPAPLMMYWVKKRFNFDMPDGYTNYCVKAYLHNCAPVSYSGFGKGTDEFKSAGTNGIWISKGQGWFEIHVGWVGPDPWISETEKWEGFSSDTTKGPSFPSGNRKSNKFRSWAVMYPGGPGAPGEANIAAGNDQNETEGDANTGYIPHAGDSNTGTKYDRVGVCTYPTVVFDVVAFPTGWENNGFQLYDDSVGGMPHNGTASIILK
jgi:hypothetical protein